MKNTINNNPEIKKEKRSLKDWLKKIGWIGFLFFTLKGLVWLAIFFGIGKLFT